MAAYIDRRRWLALSLGALAAARFGTATAGPVQRRVLFGSPVDLVLPEGTPAAVGAQVWQQLATINTQWNAWKPGALHRLNQAFRAGEAAPVSVALRHLIERAAVLEQASLGLFNPGIGGLVGAWGFHADALQDGTAPPPAAMQHWMRAAPSLSQIEFRGHLARSHNRLLQLDFGAYAKGAAIDATFDALQRQGVSHALLNLGGNLATLGQPGGRPWKVGVRDPNGPGLLVTLTTRGREAVVTSGSYERWRLADGERVTHILDPQAGRPAPGLVSVTVVHPSAALADAAATALLVAGPVRWPVVARRMGVQQVLVVDAHGRWQASDALAPRLQRAAA